MIKMGKSPNDTPIYKLHIVDNIFTELNEIEFNRLLELALETNRELSLHYIPAINTAILTIK